MTLDEIVLAVQAKEPSVKPDRVEAVVSGLGLTLDQVAPNMVGEITELSVANPGKLSVTKGFTPVAKTATGKPAAVEADANNPVVAASGKKTDLLAQIEELRQQKELAELEKQVLELKADLLSVQAEVMTVSTDLAEQENGHKLWTKVAPELAKMAAENGQVAAENAIGRQKRALGELRTISDETPLNSEIAVAALKLKQAGQRNRLQAILNATPALLPAMGATDGEPKLVTVDV